MSILTHEDIADHIFSYLDRKDLVKLAMLSKTVNRAMQVLWKDVDSKMLLSLAKLLLVRPLGDQTTLARVKWYCSWILKIELSPHDARQLSRLHDYLTLLAYALDLNPFPNLRSIAIDASQPSALLLVTKVVTPTVSRIYLALNQRKSSYDCDAWMHTFAIAITHIYEHCNNVVYLGLMRTGTATLDNNSLVAFTRFGTRFVLARISIALEYCVETVLETLQGHSNLQQLDISGQILPPNAYTFLDGPRSTGPWVALKHLVLNVRSRPAILLLQRMNVQLETLDLALTCRLLQKECQEITEVIGKKHAALIQLKIALHTHFPTQSEDELDFRKGTASLRTCTQLRELRIHHFGMEPLFLQGRGLVELIRNMTALQRMELLWPDTFVKLSTTDKHAVRFEHGISIETLGRLVDFCPSLRSIRVSGLTWELPFTLSKSNNALVVEASWLNGQPDLLARIWRCAWPDLKIVVDSRAMCCQIIRKARMELALDDIRAQTEQS